MALAVKIYAASFSDLQQGFLHPPDSARPWIFWFWLNGNITSNGITADLEAMQRVGIGGGVIIDADQSTPQGPVPFLSPPWPGIFQHTRAAAQPLPFYGRLNNHARWCRSAGP